jgi:hypothetical protein
LILHAFRSHLPGEGKRREPQDGDKPMKNLALILLLFPAILFASEVPDCRLANPAVESVISAKAQQLRGEEYCQFRNYDRLDDVDGDGKEDFIVLFTVEGIGGGGNDHINFMTVFLSNQNEPLTVQTGRRGERDPVNISVKNGQIILDTVEYTEKDPACCPTGHGKLTYRLHSNHLELVQ